MDALWNKRTGYKMADRPLGYLGEMFSSKCFQKTLRERLECGVSVGLDNLEIREIPFHTAQEFILQYEWLGTMGVTKFSYGLYADGVLTVVLCFGLTAGTRVLSEPFGDEYKSQGIVLVRGACAPWAHPHMASYFIPRALKEVRKRGYRFVIAYSDPAAGEIGTVYQATNWLFYGLTSPVTYLVRPDGKRVDPKLIHKYAKKHGISYTEQKKRFFAEGYTLEKAAPKLKYLQILGSRTEKQELRRKARVQFYPYLKRRADMREVYNDFKELEQYTRELLLLRYKLLLKGGEHGE